MSNRGRSTSGEAQVPHYSLSQHIDAAKHLRLTVTRYINRRATLEDVERAMVVLRACAPVKGEPGHRQGSTP